jgi:allantoin racemase
LTQPVARIWYQSYVDPVGQAAYIGRLQARLDAIAAPWARYEVVGISPPDRYLHRITELRCSLQAIRNAVAAERGGCAAFLQGHFQDPGLHDIRSVVDIPVVGLGEAGLLHSLTLGHRVALVTIDPYFVPYHREQIARYGLGERIVAISAVEVPVQEWNTALGDEVVADRVAGEFAEQARALVAGDGVEVIIPAGGLPALLLATRPPLELDGAVVIEPIAVAAKATEMAIALHRLGGPPASRAGAFALPPAEALSEFLEATGGPLKDGGRRAP